MNLLPVLIVPILLLGAALAPLATRWPKALSYAALAAGPAAGFVLLLLIPDGITEVPWAPQVGLTLDIRVDGLSRLMAGLALGLGVLVMVYARGYMGTGPERGRFYATLLGFGAAMTGMVMTDNLLALFVFWELTSITSWLLIGFKHNDAGSRAAALQALLVTGAGGLALLAGIVILGQVVGSYSLTIILASGDVLQASPLFPAILVLVLLGAFTKSAQFPFSFWLPGAMAAPTPVSAYLHSATMVKAGVYLLARLQPAFAGNEAWTWSLGVAGAVTALYGGLMALRQVDLKRILAFATVSTLGLLVMLIGLGTELAIKGAITLLLAHAVYKGALFMAAGSVDHGAHTRDIRQLSGLRQTMPVTFGVALVAGISMAGIPPMLGFQGKETLLAGAESAGLAWLVVALLAAIAGIVVAILSAWRPFRGPVSEAASHAHEVPFPMWGPPGLLALGGFLGGILIEPVAASIVSPAASAVLGTAYVARIPLVPEVGPVLILSLVSLAVAGALYALLGRLDPLLDLTAPLARVGPARIYQAAVAGLIAGTARLAYGVDALPLRRYLLVVLVSAIGLAFVPVLAAFGAFGIVLTAPPAERWYQVAVIGLMIVTAVALTRLRTRIAVIAAQGVVGYGIALVYVFAGAPDLGMTQVLVETLTLLLLVFVVYHLPEFREPSRALSRLRDASIAIAGGLLMTVLVLAVRSNVSYDPVSDFYIEEAVGLGQGRNIVNVILVDFRALDTLGEITVLALAALGVVGLLGLRKVRK